MASKGRPEMETWFKKKGGGFDCSNSNKAGGLLEPRIPQGVSAPHHILDDRDVKR